MDPKGKITPLIFPILKKETFGIQDILVTLDVPTTA
jgi:hypothetical protein